MDVFCSGLLFLKEVETFTPNKRHIHSCPGQIIVHKIVYRQVEIRHKVRAHNITVDRKSLHVPRRETCTLQRAGRLPEGNSCLKWRATSPANVHSQRATVAWSADSFAALREDTTFVTSYLTLSSHQQSKGSAPTHTAGESDPQHSNLFSGRPLYCNTGSIPTVQFALAGIVST